MKVPSVREKKKSWYYSDIVWLGRVALVAQRPIVVKLSRGRSVGPYVVRRSVGLVHCGKMADRIRMPFGVVGQTGPGMRQVVEFEVTVHGKGYFWGRIWGRHCNQRGLYGVRVRQRGPLPKLLWANLLHLRKYDLSTVFKCKYRPTLQYCIYSDVTHLDINDDFY